jgi:hypothetical protein
VPGRLARVVIGLGCLVVAVTPLRVAAAQSRLDASVAAFKRGDCPRAIDQGLDSLSAVAARPEPREVIGFCDVRLGVPQLAVRQLRDAVDQDPRFWEYHYALGLVLAANGRDPRPELRQALRRNPRERLAREGVRRFATANPRLWRARAQNARLPTL